MSKKVLELLKILVSGTVRHYYIIITLLFSGTVRRAISDSAALYMFTFFLVRTMRMRIIVIIITLLLHFTQSNYDGDQRNNIFYFPLQLLTSYATLYRGGTKKVSILDQQISSCHHFEVSGHFIICPYIMPK